MEIELFKGSRSFIAELSVDQDTGEIGSDNLELLVSRNPIGTCAFVLNTLASADMIDAHIQQMQAKVKALRNNAERAKEALKYAMKQTNVLKIESDDKTFKAVLSIGRDKSVEIFDEKQLPQEYLREIPVSYAPDKALIKKSIEDKFEVPGARIVEKDRLTLS